MPIVCGECRSERVNVTKNGKVKCPACLGTGKILYELRDNCYSQDCPDCAGSGKVAFKNFVAITGRD